MKICWLLTWRCFVCAFVCLFACSLVWNFEVRNRNWELPKENSAISSRQQFIETCESFDVYWNSQRIWQICHYCLISRLPIKVEHVFFCFGSHRDQSYGDSVNLGNCNISWLNENPTKFWCTRFEWHSKCVYVLRMSRKHIIIKSFGSYSFCPSLSHSVCMSFYNSIYFYRMCCFCSLHFHACVCAVQ